MNANGRLLFLLAALAVLPGCAAMREPIEAPEYVVSGAAFAELQNLTRHVPVAVRAGTVRGKNQDETGIQCRGAGRVGPPAGRTFGEFIRHALETDLRFAKVHDPAAAELNLDFTVFDFSSLSSTWTMAAEASVNGSRFPVRIEHDYGTSALAEAGAACDSAARGLVSAVQAFFHALVSDPRFAEAMRGS